MNNIFSFKLVVILQILIVGTLFLFNYLSPNFKYSYNIYISIIGSFPIFVYLTKRGSKYNWQILILSILGTVLTLTVLPVVIVIVLFFLY
ncbi:hypothetical protein ABID96_002171 [Bacillus sp. OAE603]